MKDEIKEKFIECYMAQELISEKMKLLKLFELYKKLVKTNYVGDEEQLYSSCRGSNKEKIKLELTRIMNCLSNSREDNKMIRKALVIFNELKNIDYNSSSDVNSIFYKIIDMELDLDIQIGLYKEVIDYFMRKINTIVIKDFDYSYVDEDDTDRLVENNPYKIKNLSDEKNIYENGFYDQEDLRKK